MSCDYAACAMPSVKVLDGWHFCSRHLRTHYAIRAFDNPARRSSAVHDSRLRRCTFCGEWVYDSQPCSACGRQDAAVPA